MENDIVTVRDIQTVTAEINVIKANVQQTVLSGAIEIGRRLVEAKAMLPRGEWGNWLERDAQISSRQAQRFMQLFDEYGGQQIGLFGGSNPTLLSDMPYTKALKLLVIPEEEREAFVEENNVKDISNAELDRLIKERDAAKKKAEEQETVFTATKAELDELIKDMASAERDIKTAKEAETAAHAEAEKAKAAAAKAEKAAKAAKDKLAEKEQELAALRANPEVPEAKLAEIRAEAEKAAAEKEQAEREKVTGKLKEAAERAAKEAERATAEAAAASEKLEAVQKQLKLANPDVAVFSALFSQLQETVNRLHGAFLEVAAADPDTAGKLKAAKAAYFEKVAKEEW